MIPAPAIWILAPGMIAVILYLVRRWERLILIIGISTSLLLVFVAWQWPIDELISLRLWPGMPAFRINSQMVILGRSFIIGNATRPILILIYTAIGFWLGGAYAAHVHRLFIPLSLGMAALLIASLAVNPNLYSALILETVALVSIPILAPPGKSIPRGVFRFLVFQTIGMCVILLGDWWIPSSLISGTDITRALQAAALVGLGYALVSAIFPFHTWVIMLAEHAQPYPVTFVIFILPPVIGLIGLSYLDFFDQLTISPLIYIWLRYVGVFLVLTAGVWAALQNHLGRVLGFTVLVQIGLGLIIFSLRVDNNFNPLYLGLYFAFLIPIGLSFGIWGLSLQIVKSQVGSLHFNNVQGIVQRLPFASGGLVISNFSLAGLPLLASFPLLFVLWTTIAGQSLIIALIMLAGSACLLVASMRSMVAITKSSEANVWQPSEKSFQVILLVLGCLALFIIGLFPHFILPPLINMAFIYTNPGP